MKLLVRWGTLGTYLARQNLYLMGICLGVGTGLYLLSDLFDRVDDFVESGLGLFSILAYFLAKLPLIITQILPGVFLLALVVQMGLLERSRELVALRAGGVSHGWFIRFFLCYAAIWCLLLLAFSQVLGVYGERQASRIWKEDVRKKQMDRLTLKNLWFREGPYIVEVGEGLVNQEQALNVSVYEFEADSQRLARVITAKKARVMSGVWELSEVEELDTAAFTTVSRAALLLPIRQDLKNFAIVEQRQDRSQLPVWELGRVIEELKESGSNVEQLRTAWHSKWSYAFSLAAMALVALAVTSLTPNIYAGIGAALVLVFLQYGLQLLSLSAGQKGVLPPLIAAWSSNAVFIFAAGSRLAWVSNPILERRIKSRLHHLQAVLRRN